MTDKQTTDLDCVVKQLNTWMKEDYWKVYCEPQYKFVKKQFFVEEYLADDIRTYKFYCFNGEPHVVYISSNGENGEKDLYLDYYDMDWNWLSISSDTHVHSPIKEEKPKNFDKMVELCRTLSAEFPFVRVDLYNVNGEIYFSELTFIPTGGMMKLKPENVISEWGELLHI